MNAFHLGAALSLLLMILAGLRRVIAGPSAADRVLSAQLFATLGVAIVLLLSHAEGDRSGADLAVVFALLAAVFNVAFARHADTLFARRKAGKEGENEHS